ncbi:GNAT family N-acetyltransferase [Glycomyces sp. TRM65418]|uniref:GNAT family N-acetyltransferase n=1 Tax=Glycomyces sp. TRM65418 TaxID=2867006 RepID=UPI001CE56DC1|nr:GNAT family N-acetyltransferase [Glycomyces sp. TRM65418]MCC3763522.1 GNAT family N-acetyltransferase [Glycomyces sp. TRM65418]QZD57506.1 GNAT family N-acetyltransferase [Glycomyces sp. TRM65418]
MTHYDIVRVEPSDHALVRSWLDAQQAAHEHDTPHQRPWNPMRPLSSLVTSSADGRNEQWAAVVDGRVLGSLSLSLSDLDNTHLAGFDLSVRPGERRRGVGSALLRHAEQRAAEEGRDTMSVWLAAPGPGDPTVGEVGSVFAVGKGFKRSLECAVRVCDLDAVDEDALDRLWEDAWTRAEGFEVVAFVGAPPEDLVDGMAYLHARMYTDMPLGEWDLQEAVVDRDRLLDWERRRRLRGELHLQVAVRHKESGAVAGFTEIIVEGGEERHCVQGDTIVDPRFRGHRLGTILKIANQRRVREWRPRMRYVWTGNAVSNEHMISINEAVGYRISCLENVYQKKLA